MMSAILAILMMVPAVCTRPDAEYSSGYFSLYGQSPTDGTIDYHQTISGKLPQDLSPYVGVIAAIDDCSLVGQDAWIRLTDSYTPIEYWNRWLPVKIFDCGGHQESIENFFKPNNIIGELGYYIANDAGVYHLSRGIAGDLALENPARSCSDEPAMIPVMLPDITPESTPAPTPIEIAEAVTPEPAVTRIILPRLVTKVYYLPTAEPVVAHIGDDFDFREDFWTAPMFTDKQAVTLAALLSLFFFSGILLFADLFMKLIALLKGIQARLRKSDLHSPGDSGRKRGLGLFRRPDKTVPLGEFVHVQTTISTESGESTDRDMPTDGG
jgi:hypothetical protein